MEIGVMKARPPHLRFANKPVEDRNKSIEAGHTVFHNVPHVFLTPVGSKDTVEKPVQEWLDSVRQQVEQERMPADWAEKFYQAFEHWKRGEEIPVEGTALVNWPAISPAELATCKAVHILTLEDLSAANEETLRRLGMGGLQLKQRAIQFLAASAGPGKLVAENKALSERLSAAEARNLTLEQRLVALEASSGGKSPVKVTAAEPGIEEKL